MRILVASLLAVAACGGPQAKKESSIVEGGDTPATCCCKTLPETAEKEIVPVYAMQGRMECSTQHGGCVPDVQCNGSQQPAAPASTPTQSTEQQGSTGVPPPPDLSK